MFRKKISYIMVIALIVSAITYSPASEKKVSAAVAGPADSGWTLQWSDEFTGNSLNTSNWSYNTGTGDWGWGNGEAQCYTSRTDNVRVSDGTLKLIAKKESYEGSNYTSGRINSKNKQYFKYGKMEARIKVENGNQVGVWPAFWMQGNVDLSWPARGELDIMEHRNEEWNSLGTIHWGTSNSTHRYWGPTPYEYDDNDDGIEAWHVYGVTWDENTIKWYVDDTVFQTAYLTSSNKEYFQRNYYFILNLALGSEQTPFTLYNTVPDDYQTATMYVDYVRAYSYDNSSTETGAQENTTASSGAYTQATADSAWHTVGTSGFRYKFKTGMGVEYKGGTNFNDPFDVNITTQVNADGDFQTRTPAISVTAGETYTLTYNVANVGVKDEGAHVYAVVTNASSDSNIISNYSEQVAVAAGTSTDIVLTYEAPSSGQVYFKLNISYTKATEFILTPHNLRQGEELTTVPEVTTLPEETTIAGGYTAGITDSSWHNLGAWQYYFSSGAKAQGSYKGGANLNDFSVYINKKAEYDWGAKIKPNLSFSTNTTYYYNFTVNTDADGCTFKMNKDVNDSGTKLIDQTLANGINTFSGSFTTGSSGDDTLILDLALLSTGTTFTITSFSVSENEPTTVAPETTVEETTTKEPEVTTVAETTTKEPEVTTVEVTTKEQVTDPYANEVWKYTTDNSGYKICIVGYQTDYEFQGAFHIEGDKLYIAGTARIIAPDYKKVTLNGTQLSSWKGAWFIFNISDINQNSDNTIVVKDRNNRTFTLILRKINEEETTTLEVITEVEPIGEISYDDLDWVTVSGSNSQYQVASLEDFGIMYTYMNRNDRTKTKEVLIVPNVGGVGGGTYYIWPSFSNESFNGVSGSYSLSAGIYIPTTQIADNSYNIYSATSAVQSKTFHIIIKSGTPAVPTTPEPTTPEPTTEEPTTEEPVTEEPITEEPITEEPITEEPVTEEPVTKEPVTEEPETEKPTVEEQTTVQPETEEPSTKPEADPNFVISKKQLALTNGLCFYLKADKTLFTNGGYTDPTMVVEFNNSETVIEDCVEESQYYAFPFNDIAPHQMGETFTATLHAYKNGVEYVSPALQYSVEQYCFDVFNAYKQYTYEQYAKTYTLLVDLLNYGAQAQTYTNTNTDNLVNRNLTSEQQSHATTLSGELVNSRNYNYETISNPSVTWQAAALNLRDSIVMRLRFSAKSIDGLTVKARDEKGNEWDIDAEAFESAGSGTYNVYFDQFNVGRMSDIVYLTVYNGETPVSNTCSFSIESYAAVIRQNAGTYDDLNALTTAMMKYGKAAKAYAS